MAESKVTIDPDKWVNRIDEMLGSGDYDWAEEFLTDVREQIVDKDTVSQKQTAAILNIRRSRQ